MKKIIKYSIFITKEFLRNFKSYIKKIVFEIFCNYKISSKNFSFKEGKGLKINKIGNFFPPEYKIKNEDFFSATSVSKNKKHFLKIEFLNKKNKKKLLIKEAKIIKYLNNKNCLSAPKVVDYGKVYKKDIFYNDKNISNLVNKKKITNINYLITEYIKDTKKKVNFIDIFFSLLEQKGLGIYNRINNPQNIKFDEKKNISIFTDYTYAKKISKKVILLSSKKFIEWCKKDNKDFLEIFPFFNKFLFLNSLIHKEAFKLLNTTLFKKQVTTNTKDGIYHTIDNKIFYISGIRSLNQRNLVLNKIKFKPKEKILDIGCNAGLLSHYLYKKGCNVTGAEMDMPIVTAANMITNSLCMPIKFIFMDLDEQKKIPKYDTICLFSVFHHTKKLKENGKKIVKACNRIIIECKKIESGSKPVKKEENSKWIKNAYWKKTSSWNYNNENELASGLKKLFPGFKKLKKIGNVDRSRSIYELKK